MDETRLKQIEALLGHEVVWSEMTVEELVAEVRRLREQNRGLRVLLRSPYQGEYAYVSDAAIDAALAERDPAHERSSAPMRGER